MTLMRVVAHDLPPDVVGRSRRRPRWTQVARPSAARCTVILAVAGAAGAALLVAADRAAEWNRGSQFAAVLAGPAASSRCPRSPGGPPADLSAPVRLGVLVGYAGFTYLPKLLRNPAGPLYHDEFAHWRQSREILLDGRLFEANPIVRVIGDFPGLHATVAVVSALTGVSVWHAALFVLVAAHVLVVLGVAVLAQDIWQDPRVAAAGRGHLQPEQLVPLLRHPVRVRVAGRTVADLDPGDPAAGAARRPARRRGSAGPRSPCCWPGRPSPPTT